MAETRARTYRRYTDEFKAHAVRLSEHPDMRVNDVADALDIHPIMLSRWRKEYREGKIKADKRKTSGISSKKIAEHQRIRELKRKNEALKIENDLLKKTIAFNLEKRKMRSSS